MTAAGNPGHTEGKAEDPYRQVLERTGEEKSFERDAGVC
jgi:hypothetical protein